MKVIFLEDDRVEEVSEGYARNYLLPRKLAVPVTPQALAAAEKRKEKKKAEVEQKRVEMQALSDRLSSGEFVVEAEAGEEGKLFGSVTASDIVGAVMKATGVELDKRKVELNDPIKITGEYSVKVKLFQEITAALKIVVSAK